MYDILGMYISSMLGEKMPKKDKKRKKEQAQVAIQKPNAIVRGLINFFNTLKQMFYYLPKYSRSSAQILNSALESYANDHNAPAMKVILYYLGQKEAAQVKAKEKQAKNKKAKRKNKVVSELDVVSSAATIAMALQHKGDVQGADLLLACCTQAQRDAMSQRFFVQPSVPPALPSALKPAVPPARKKAKKVVSFAGLPPEPRTSQAPPPVVPSPSEQAKENIRAAMDDKDYHKALGLVGGNVDYLEVILKPQYMDDRLPEVLHAHYKELQADYNKKQNSFMPAGFSWQKNCMERIESFLMPYYVEQKDYKNILDLASDLDTLKGIVGKIPMGEPGFAKALDEHCQQMSRALSSNLGDKPKAEYDRQKAYVDYMRAQLKEYYLGTENYSQALGVMTDLKDLKTVITKLSSEDFTIHDPQLLAALEEYYKKNYFYAANPTENWHQAFIYEVRGALLKHYQAEQNPQKVALYSWQAAPIDEQHTPARVNPKK